MRRTGIIKFCLAAAALAGRRPRKGASSCLLPNHDPPVSPGLFLANSVVGHPWRGAAPQVRRVRLAP